MGWGRIDDGFDDHPKVLAILDEEDMPAAAMAIAVWTLCFTWAHRNTRRKGKTPGLLPAGLPRRYFGSEAKDGVQLLIKHGLWDAREDGGWMIHDFGDFLPTEQTSEVRAEAGRRGAAVRWAEKHAQEAAEVVAMAQSHAEDGNLPSACHDGDGKAMASDGSRAPARRDPTPIPEPLPVATDVATTTQEASPPSSGAQTRAQRATRLPMTFEVAPEMRAWARSHPKANKVDLDYETEKFCNYWRSRSGKEATKIDWVATWRNWILTASERLPDRMPFNGRASPASGANRHIDDLDQDQRTARNPFTGAVRASQATGDIP